MSEHTTESDQPECEPVVEPKASGGWQAFCPGCGWSGRRRSAPAERQADADRQRHLDEAVAAGGSLRSRW